jgi:hypothetical protein
MGTGVVSVHKAPENYMVESGIQDKAWGAIGK